MDFVDFDLVQNCAYFLLYNPIELFDYGFIQTISL